MSIENHPNIHAVKFTCAIVEAFDDALRGNACKPENESKAFAILHKRLVEFVSSISTELDVFGIEE